MNNDKLKPCPFCGHGAVIGVFKTQDGYKATVQCTNCLANMASITFDDEETAEQEVTKAWNTRRSETCSTCEWFGHMGDCRNEKSKYNGFLMKLTDKCSMYEYKTLV